MDGKEDSSANDAAAASNDIGEKGILISIPLQYNLEFWYWQRQTTLTIK